MTPLSPSAGGLYLTMHFCSTPNGKLSRPASEQKPYLPGGRSPRRPPFCGRTSGEASRIGFGIPEVLPLPFLCPRRRRLVTTPSPPRRPPRPIPLRLLLPPRRRIDRSELPRRH